MIHHVSALSRGDFLLTFSFESTGLLDVMQAISSHLGQGGTREPEVTEGVCVCVGCVCVWQIQGEGSKADGTQRNTDEKSKSDWKWNELLWQSHEDWSHCD